MSALDLPTIYKMPYGVNRRVALLDFIDKLFINENRGLRVNYVKEFAKTRQAELVAEPSHLSIMLNTNVC